MARAGKEYITTAEIRAMNEIKVKGNDGQEASLYLALDSAPQLLFIMEGIFPYCGKAKERLSDLFALDGTTGEKTLKMMSNLRDYHSHNMPKIAGADTNAGEIAAEIHGSKAIRLSRQNTYEFFSLARHLLDQGDPAAEVWREHIRAAFKVMGMGEPMGVEQLKACQTHIEAFTAPQKRAKGG